MKFRVTLSSPLNLLINFHTKFSPRKPRLPFRHRWSRQPHPASIIAHHQKCIKRTRIRKRIGHDTRYKGRGGGEEGERGEGKGVKRQKQNIGLPIGEEEPKRSNTCHSHPISKPLFNAEHGFSRYRNYLFHPRRRRRTLSSPSHPLSCDSANSPSYSTV